MEKLCRLLALHDETLVDELLIDLLDLILVVGLVSGPILDLSQRQEPTVLLTCNIVLEKAKFEG